MNAFLILKLLHLLVNGQNRRIFILLFSEKERKNFFVYS